MSLASRQRDRAVEIALRQVLLLGKPLDQARVARAVEAHLPEVLGRPFFKLREQTRRGKFRVDWQNEMFEEAAIDLDLLYAENIEIVERILSHLSLAEVTGRRLSQEVRAVQDLLTDLLMSSQRGTGFFFTLFDSFTDLSKIDQTRGDVALDPAAGLITLLPTENTNRLTMDHLLDRADPALQVLSPANSTTRRVPGTTFGNAFEDLFTAWQQQILTDSQDGTLMTFIVPVVPEGDAPISISRIQLFPISSTPFEVDVLWSSDGTAFSRFPGVEPSVADQDCHIIDVPEQLVTAIQFRLKKNGPDGEDQIDVEETVEVEDPDAPPVTTLVGGVPVTTPATKTITQTVSVRKFSYVFGFRQISFWQMGYKRTGTLFTKTLEPQDTQNLRSIGKVSLTVDHVVPPGTKIEYAVAGDLEPETFLPISPMNQKDENAPQIVDFSRSQRSNRTDNQFTIQTSEPPTSLETVRGVEYFSIRSITDPTIFQSVRLWRGKNSWTVKRNEECEIRSVRNLYIDFQNNDVQKLYTFETSERIASHPANTGDTNIRIATRFPILLTGESFNAAQDLQLPTDVTRPTYAVAQLIRRPPSGTISETTATGSLTFKSRSDTFAALGNTSQQTSPTAGRTGATMTIANFTSAALIPPVVGLVADFTNQPIRVTYTIASGIVTGTFDILDAVIDDNGTLTLNLNDPDEIIRTASGTVAALSASWEILSVDITRSISGIDGNQIQLARNQKIDAADLLEVTYRRALVAAETPITATVVVKDSTSPSLVYEQGTHYTVDLSTRTISRVPNTTTGIQRSADGGAIPVRVDFDYEIVKLGLFTYRTFIFAPDETPKIPLQKITVDTNNGEEVLLETRTGFLDLNDREEIPELSSGWHQVVVFSDPILKDDGSVNTECALYKTINLLDRIDTGSTTGRFVFPASAHPSASSLTGRFAGYFTKQTAFLGPMQQVPYRMLTSNVRKSDRGVFAVKAAGEAPVTGTAVVAINFDPRSSSDILYFPPDVTGGGVPLSREDFELDYSFIPTTVTSLTGIKLRATFERSPGFRGSLTPILRAYTLRVSF